MDRQRRQALRSWLEAERRGDDLVAERALAGLWRRLGRPAPRPGFARRTLRRAGLAPGRGWALPGPRWLPRAALAAAFVLTAVPLAVAPVSAIAVARIGDRLLVSAIGLVVAVSERLAHGLTAWSVAERISGSLVDGLAQPPALIALGLALLTSFLAFGWLTRLLALERSNKHA